MQPQQFSKERGLFGKLSPGTRKLEGKTFYLDNVKRHSTALLLEAVSLLGGKIESFLHKDVSFVVTGSQGRLKEKNGIETREEASKGSQLLTRDQKNGLNNDKLPTKPSKSMACASRGKALLEKAIRNNERLRGSSVLSDARSWGVKILYVDDVLVCLKQLTRESFSPKHKRIEKTSTKQRHPAVKAAALRTPYLKIEDLSRRYRPLHVQSMAFPALFYSGRYSPFEPPPPPQFDKQPEHENSKTRSVKKIVTKAQDKSPVGVFCNPSPWRPRKKDQSYCECCCETFTNLEEHLQSDQHRSFVLNPLNYRTIDQLVAEMSPGFDPSPAEETPKRPSTPLPLDNVRELDPLTDAEMERAVRALQSRGSSPTADDSITTGIPLFCGSPSLFTFENQTAPPAFQPEANRQRPDLLEPRASSPVMPVLTPEPRVKELTYQRMENQPSDPYGFPPVLSPQIPDSPDAMEARSPYPEPPVLSPQKFPSLAELTYETNVPDQTVPQPSPPEKRVLFGSDGLFGFNSSFRRRSNSLPKQSPKKRCRTVSSGHSHRKRRRTASLGDDGRWSELKPQQGCFSFDERLLSDSDQPLLHIH
ncbi:DBF4-like protein B [Oryzias melastigma]|uniref:DBF4-like protein B n=1 Tax=Oryzias melastigma TaxID=30732 RepID=A0A834C915_ORYME|nr:DBF4-like protein B [Oryzias melastigma]